MSCGCSTAKRYTIELKEIIQHNEETFSFDFVSEDITSWAEGDSSKLYVKMGDGEMGKKFSYATLPDEKTLRFTTRIKEERSVYKQQLADMKIGDTLEVTEPSGDFKLKRVKRPVLLLSNGVGIAAVRSLVKHYEDNTLFVPEMMQINVDSKGHIYKDEFDLLKESLSNFSSYYVTNRKAFYGLVDHELQLMIARHKIDPLVYVVGSNSFVNENVSHLKDVGFSEEDIITDGHLSTGGCGCSSTEGCGCGGNLVPAFSTEGMVELPVLN